MPGGIWVDPQGGDSRTLGLALLPLDYLAVSATERVIAWPRRRGDRLSRRLPCASACTTLVMCSRLSCMRRAGVPSRRRTRTAAKKQ
jgi:hypothetical protein